MRDQIKIKVTGRRGIGKSAVALLIYNTLVDNGFLDIDFVDDDGSGLRNNHETSRNVDTLPSRIKVIGETRSVKIRTKFQPSKEQ